MQMLQTKGFAIIGEDEEFKYLTRMPMDSVTEENVDKLKKEVAQKTIELNKLQEMSAQQMWQQELANLEKEYYSYKEERERQQSGATKKAVVKKKTKIALSDKV